MIISLFVLACHERFPSRLQYCNVEQEREVNEAVQTKQNQDVHGPRDSGTCTPDGGRARPIMPGAMGPNLLCAFQQLCGMCVGLFR